MMYMVGLEIVHEGNISLLIFFFFSHITEKIRLYINFSKSNTTKLNCIPFLKKMRSFSPHQSLKLELDRPLATIGN